MSSTASGRRSSYGGQNDGRDGAAVKGGGSESGVQVGHAIEAWKAHLLQYQNNQYQQIS